MFVLVLIKEVCVVPLLSTVLYFTVHSRVCGLKVMNLLLRSLVIRVLENLHAFVSCLGYKVFGTLRARNSIQLLRCAVSIFHTHRISLKYISNVGHKNRANIALLFSIGMKLCY